MRLGLNIFFSVVKSESSMGLGLSDVKCHVTYLHFGKMVLPTPLNSIKLHL